jgi:hypothetical protein
VKEGFCVRSRPIDRFDALRGIFDVILILFTTTTAVVFCVTRMRERGRDFKKLNI